MEKTGGGSVEFVGYVSALDELKFSEGLAIVGPNSTLSVGPASVQIVGPEAHLALMSEACFGKRSNAGSTILNVLVEGRLTGGLPERPLTKDVTLGLSCKLERPGPYRGDDVRSSGRRASGAVPTVSRPGAGNVAEGTRPYGLRVEPRGGVRVHSADPAKARLVIRWHGWIGWKNSDDVPRHITAALLGDVQLNGVLFDDFRKGGLMLARPTPRAE